MMKWQKNTDKEKGKLPIRILHISNLHLGGIQTHIIELQKNIDRQKVQFDFLSYSREKDEFYDEIVWKLGGKKHWYGERKDNLLGQAIYLFFIIIKNKYKIVDIPVSYPSSTLFVLIAKLCGAKVFVHAHSDHGQKNITKSIQKRANILFSLSDYQFACSKGAAIYCFGQQNADKVVIEKNGIDLKRFQYNESKRNDYRTMLQLEQSLVIGQVGRLEYPKNQEFSIQLVKQLVNNGKKVKLLLIGEGSKKQELHQLVVHLGIQEDVLFLGERTDIPELLCAMDIFLLPSFFEGFPVTAMEAQATGLPIIASTVITHSIKINNNVHFFDLSEADYWYNYVNSFAPIYRESGIEQIKMSGYDIMDVAKTVEKFYLNSIKIK